MFLLAVKLIVTPALVGAASLAGRKWGVVVSGWLVGLPLTSGPVALFLALDQGAGFAAAAAVGMLAGTLSQAAYALGYISPRLPGWLSRAGAGAAAFAVATVVLGQCRLSPVGTFSIVVAGLAATIAVLSGRPAPGSGASGPARGAKFRSRWDVYLRMLVATAIVVGISSIAPVLGPYVSGLVSPFPVYGAVIAIAAHRDGGISAACSVLRGLAWGLFAPTTFFLALAMTLPTLGIPAAFAIAVGAGMAAQGASLAVLRSKVYRKERRQLNAP